MSIAEFGEWPAREVRIHLDRQGEPAQAGVDILREDSLMSYHAKHRVADNDIFNYPLTLGDNVLPLSDCEWEIA
ncbi:MAG: hypothetical protein Q7J38_15100 [Gallionella sp.]|nr:hypothetical protein [Gallionella sp.]